MMQALVKRQPHSPTQSISEISEEAQALVSAGFLPEHLNTKEKVIAVGLKARELGRGLWWGVENLYPVTRKNKQGVEKVTGIGIEGLGYLDLIQTNCPKASFEYIETNDNICIIEANRPGYKKQKFQFTIEEARKRNYLYKFNWKTMPDVMLQWKAINKMARGLFADCISSVPYTRDELEDMHPEENQALDINKKVQDKLEAKEKPKEIEGEIIDAEFTDDSDPKDPAPKSKLPAKKRGRPASKARSNPKPIQTEVEGDQAPTVDEVFGQSDYASGKHLIGFGRDAEKTFEDLGPDLVRDKIAILLENPQFEPTRRELFIKNANQYLKDCEKKS